MNIPRPLAPWAESLALFPQELAHALGPMIQRLDAAIGPLRIRCQTGEGDPDGYEGLSRRGTFERLLISEWLIAEELPDEFARRSAMGELAFLQPARREPARGRISFALFDAGPEQIGSPRLAHLAALIVLARRAEAAGFAFYWGIAQQPDTPPTESFSTASARTFLEARCVWEANEEHLERWEEPLAKLGGVYDVEDVWMIGGKRFTDLTLQQGHSRLQVEEALEPGVRRLNGSIRVVGRTDREFSLDLPEDRLCARLLRDPFENTLTTPTRSQAAPDTGSNLLFLGNGTKLAARNGGVNLLIYSVPNSPRAEAGRPKLYRPNTQHPLVAVGRMRRTTFVLQAAKEGRTLHMECAGGKRGKISPNDYALPLSVDPVPMETGGALSACLSAPGAMAKEYDFLFMVHGALLGAARTEAGNAGHLVVLDSGPVVAVTPTDKGIAYFCKRTSLWFLVSIGEDGQKRTHREVEGTGRAFFGYGSLFEHPRFGLFAAEREDGRWQIFHGNPARCSDPLIVKTESDERVVGVVSTSEYPTPALVMLDAGGRHLSLRCGSSTVYSLPTASARIRQVTVSHADPTIAYVTEQNEVVIYSLLFEAPTLRLAPPESPR